MNVPALLLGCVHSAGELTSSWERHSRCYYSAITAFLKSVMRDKSACMAQPSALLHQNRSQIRWCAPCFKMHFASSHVFVTSRSMTFTYRQAIDRFALKRSFSKVPEFATPFWVARYENKRPNTAFYLPAELRLDTGSGLLQALRCNQTRIVLIGWLVLWTATDTLTQLDLVSHLSLQPAWPADLFCEKPVKLYFWTVAGDFNINLFDASQLKPCKRNAFSQNKRRIASECEMHMRFPKSRERYLEVVTLAVKQATYLKLNALCAVK